MIKYKNWSINTCLKLYPKDEEEDEHKAAFLTKLEDISCYGNHICVKRNDLILIYKENKSLINILNRIEIEMWFKDNILTDLLKKEKFNLNNTSDINDDDINKLCDILFENKKKELNLDDTSIEYIKNIIKQSLEKNNIRS